MGFIKLDEDSEAIKIYRDNKKDVFISSNYSTEMTKAFVEKNDYDSAFSMLHEDSWSSDESLIIIAKGYMKTGEKILKDEHRKLIASIVMPYNGAISNLDILHNSQPGSDLYQEFQKKFIDTINKNAKNKQ